MKKEIQLIHEFIGRYSSVLKIDILNNFHRDQIKKNIFQEGFNLELDEIQEKLQNKKIILNIFKKL